MITSPVCMSTKDLIRSSVTGKLKLDMLRYVALTKCMRCVISAVEYIAISRVFTLACLLSVLPYTATAIYKSECLIID